MTFNIHVFEADCPKSGERWIADTKISGFGLRLWSTASGGQKAFAIRISDLHSRKVRRSFNTETAWGTKLDLSYSNRTDELGLGEYLEEARSWARDEIDRTKGRPTVHDEQMSEYNAIRKLVRRLTLQRAADAVLLGLCANDASQRYLDRLDKLFTLHLLQPIKLTTLEKLNSKRVAKALVRANTSAGNVRALRSFLSQIMERAASFDGPIGRFHDIFAEEFAIQWERTRDVRYPELRKLKPAKYEKIFRALEADEVYWQQSLAIRLYFIFRAPLSRILSGQWSHIHEGYWYPYLPSEKEYWFECREKIDDHTQQILNRLKILGNREFDGSNCWFPSKRARSVSHIRTVEHAWQMALRKSRVRYYPLREFSRSFRDFNNPSYYLSFLNQYRPMIRRVQNAAEVFRHFNSPKK